MLNSDLWLNIPLKEKQNLLLQVSFRDSLGLTILSRLYGRLYITFMEKTHTSMSKENSVFESRKRKTLSLPPEQSMDYVHTLQHA